MKKILQFIAIRLSIFLVLLFCVTMLTFLLLRAAPGNPYSSDRSLSDFQEALMRKKLCLDDPIFTQYGCYVKGIIDGTMPSMKFQNKTPFDLLFPGMGISEGLPASALLGLIALILASVLGTGAGVIAAKRKNTGVDYGVMAIIMIGITIPAFVIGPLLQESLADLFGLPKNGWCKGPIAQKLSGEKCWPYFVLPTITLAIAYAAYFARFARTGMLEVINEDYIRTAQAKGLPNWLITLRHEMRLGLVKNVTFLGPAASGIVVGSLVVEKIFNVTGIGNLLVESATDKDFTTLMTVVVMLFTLLFFANLCVDISYYVIDPRTRQKEKE